MPAVGSIPLLDRLRLISSSETGMHEYAFPQHNSATKTEPTLYGTF